jgi:hypothetical protein
VAFTDANNGWAVGYPGTILHTTNGGASWSPQSSGTTNYLYGVAFTDANNGWAVGRYGTILHHGGGQSVVPGGEAIPAGFELAQNYPNPFNPSTTIRYSIPRATLVSIDIFDLLGRKVGNLVSGTMQPGTHSVEWNCPNCSAGMYFVTMSAGEHTLSRKMLLMK